MDSEHIWIACDHGGYEAKKNIVAAFTGKGYLFNDVGSFSDDICRYPHYASHVCEAVASGKAPDDIRTMIASSSEAAIIALLKQAGFASSNSDARRLIEGGGIKLDGKTVNDVNLTVKHNSVISRGKNRFVKIVLE